MVEKEWVQDSRPAGNFMIISHRYRFIFIKTFKTAGTSIEVYLSTVCGEEDVFTPIIPPHAPHRPRNNDGFRNHMTAVEVAERAPHLWSSYYRFCVERNPWDKVLSAYFMYRNSALHGGDEALALDDYLAAGRLPHNLPLYTVDSRIAVDAVLRYENLDAELAKTFAGLGVPFPGRVPFLAKAEWRTDRRHYRDVLTSSQAARIAEAFSNEIAMHNYAF